MVRRKKRKPYRRYRAMEAIQILKEYEAAEDGFKKEVLEKHNIRHSLIRYWREKFSED